MFGKNKSIQKKDDASQKQVSVSKGNIEIRHEGKPVSGTDVTGYVYLLVDRSASMDGNKLRQAKSGALKFAK